jgi:hypothetical protein
MANESIEEGERKWMKSRQCRKWRNESSW